MREITVEKYLVKRVKQSGGVVRKLEWVNTRNAPDRAVFLNGVHFVELKRPGEKPRPGQVREHARMRKHGARVYVLDTKDQIDEFIKTICR